MELRIQLRMIESLMRVFASGLTRLAARRRARRQAMQLAAMSEHELLDLGIGRSEVPALLRATTPSGTERGHAAERASAC
jgi:uncharacterized protein YjiS (DUF1127 family)